VALRTCLSGGGVPHADRLASVSQCGRPTDEREHRGISLSGDTVIIASDEAHPSGANSANGRDYYKGERLTVEKYGSGSGTLTVAPHIHFDYDPSTSSNRVYVLDEQELTIGKGITFQGDPTKDQRGLLLNQADAQIAARFENITERCIATVKSRLHFSGVIKSVSNTTNPTTRYGVHVAGHSELHVDSAEIWGGRHAVTQASGGFEDLGLAGGDSSINAGYSSRYTVSGGTYGTLATDTGHRLSAIDTHGTTLEATITGANVYGGVSVAADYMTVTDSYIEAHDFRACYVTNDVAATDKDWCSLKFNDNTVRIVGSANNVPEAPFLETKRDPGFDGNEGMRSLEVGDNTFIGDYYTSSTRPLALRLPVRDGKVVRDNTFKLSYTGQTLPGQTQMLIEAWEDVDFRGNEIEGAEVEIQPWTTGVTIDCSGTTLLDSFRRGLRLDGVDKDPDTGDPVAHKIEKVIADDVRIENCSYTGLSLRNVGDLYVSGIVKDNGTNTSATENQRSNVDALDVDQVVCRNADLRASESATKHALVVNQGTDSWSPSTTALQLTNIDVRTATSADEVDVADASVSIEVQHGIRTNDPESYPSRFDRLDVPDSSTDPDNNGEVRRNAGDVKVYSGGEVRNLSDVVYASTPTTFEEEVTINDTDGLTVQDGGNDRVSVEVSGGHGKIALLKNSGAFYAQLERGGNSFVDVGSLGIGTNNPSAAQLDVDGAVQLGDTTTALAGMIRWTGSDFEGYDGSSWVSLT